LGGKHIYKAKIADWAGMTRQILPSWEKFAGQRMRIREEN